MHAPLKLLLALAAGSALLGACGGGGGGGGNAQPPAPPPPLARGTLASGPVQVAPDDRSVWVANPEAGSVTRVRIEAGGFSAQAEVAVGAEPRNLAISPDGRRVVVANAGEDTLSVIDTTLSPPAVVRTVQVGMEPYGVAYTPNGRRIYVANALQKTISVLDAASYELLATIDDEQTEPRGLAITDDGDADDDDETVYVTQFLAAQREGATIGADDYKQGQVSVISTATHRLTTTAVLPPMADTGFRSDGSALKRIAATEKVVTGAFPNMLQAIALKGGRAYLPNTCASPDGPVKFNVNMQSCLSVLDLATNAEGLAQGQPQSINMNRGVQFETADEADPRQRLFHAVPWAIAFRHQRNEGYAVSLSSNVIVKVTLDANGTPSINAPAAAGQASGIVRVLVGQGPRGIAISRDDRFAFVANENSRDLSVVDLASDTVVATVPTTALPEAGSEAARRLAGKAIFDSSTGVDLAVLGSVGTVDRKRLSSEGWGSCFACHGFGKTDGVTWIFNSGPRRSLPLHASFNPKDRNDIKVLNSSGVNDEVQDFELNIRNVSGGLGLINQPDGTPVPTSAVVALGAPANAGRSEHLDALSFYVATAIRTPRAQRVTQPSAQAFIDAGRAAFASANCSACHGGAGWSSARRGTAPQPVIDASEGIGQLAGFLRGVGTFDAAAAHELRQNGAPALGVRGYVPPSLLGVGALAPYLHDGSAESLEAVLENVAHRSAGTGGNDTLQLGITRAQLASFLRSIDASTEPFPVTALQP